MVFCLMLCAVGGAVAAVLPKKGDIAVLVYGPDPQHVAIADAMIVDELVNHGYRVVDEARIQKIRAAAARAKADQLAMQGNFGAIMKISAGYKASATVVANVRADIPRLNRAKLYTGTASVTLTAVTSGGIRLGGKTNNMDEGKKGVGYTPGEAMRKAIASAVQEAIAQIF